MKSQRVTNTSFVKDSEESTQRGAVAVELAILLPILVMVVFAIIEFGRFYSATITVTHASREAVRRVALGTGSASTAGISAASPLVVTVSTGPACVAGADATATVSTQFDYNIPFVRAGMTSIARTARMRCGG